MPADLAELELITRLKQGDAEAFAELYKAYFDLAYIGAFRVLRNEHDAEDATQDTFLRIREKISSFRGDCALSSWIYRLAVHIALNELRERGAVMSSIDDLEEDEEGHPEAPKFDPVPRLAIEKALEQVPRRDGRLFWRKQNIEGLTPLEIAAETGATFTLVVNQLYCTRKKLREILGAKR